MTSQGTYPDYSYEFTDEKVDHYYEMFESIFELRLLIEKLNYRHCHISNGKTNNSVYESEYIENVLLLECLNQAYEEWKD